MTRVTCPSPPLPFILEKGASAELNCPASGRESRLDMQNAHFLATFDGRAYLAPAAETAQRVLDVGTGTGIWAIQYADEHPSAQVIGVDLSPIQPDITPPNCSFEIDDLKNEWTWSYPFDLHQSSVQKPISRRLARAPGLYISDGLRRWDLPFWTSDVRMEQVTRQRQREFRPSFGRSCTPSRSDGSS